MKFDEKATAARLVDRHGLNHQLLKAAEEFGELSTALIGYVNGERTLREVEAEVVDAVFCLNYIDRIIPMEKVELLKLALIARLDAGEYGGRGEK